MRHHVIAGALAFWCAAVALVSGQLHPAYLRNHQKIEYSISTPTDRVAELNRRLEAGELTLRREGPSGYLTAVLEALGVPVESQLLVFSKTSFQANRINPRNPRAIYFNDHVSVGWVRGGPVLELIGQDPKLGTVFYTLSQSPSDPPRFERNDSCVSCHLSEATRFVPGMFVTSVFPAPDGSMRYGPVYMTDHRSPFEIRWGGWYVTGTHRADAHMGNAVVNDGADLASLVTPASAHVTSLEGRFEMTGYLSPHSDIVALLVLEHQAAMVNLITRVGWEARVGTADAGRPLEEAAAELADYMLFIDETPLPGPIAGTSNFASRFAAQGPRDRQGRSLRELSLNTRLMKYPCSYLIYSEMFDGLPADAKSAVYARLWDVLSGRAKLPQHAHLTAADRQAIVEILRDTKKDLPAQYHE